jgi:hypothetical protein
VGSSQQGLVRGAELSQIAVSTTLIRIGTHQQEILAPMVRPLMASEMGMSGFDLAALLIRFEG